ncbi:MAG: SMP-30/gluconolactonase/LRE family protein, partial [Shimia sp.]
PQGGFWIGTMGLNADPNAGAIYRWYKGELRRLYAPITIPNAICFAPDGRTAHFCDTPTQRILRVALDGAGWPKGEPEVHVDLTDTPYNPDGAVIDAEGLLWNAQWGARRVAAYDPSGAEVRSVDFPPLHTSCPAFGGADLRTLFCTSALQGLPAADRDAPHEGATHAVADVATGQAEHGVLLL